MYTGYGDGIWLKYDAENNVIIQRRLVCGGFGHGNHYVVTVLDEDNNFIEEYAEDLHGSFMYNL